MAKKIDIIDVMIAVHRGELKIVVNNGYFLLEDMKSGERVRLNEANAVQTAYGRLKCPICGANMDGEGR